MEITQTATQCNIETDKTAYKIGDTVKLTIKPSDAEKYPIFASLKMNGVECASSATTDEAGNKVYSFVAYDKQITVEAEYTDKLNANITITDAAAYGLNGVAFTLTNKSNSSIVYNVTVADGKLAIPNAEIGTYSVKAVLIPGTTTAGADLELKQETLTYNAGALIFNPRQTETCNVQFGVNNSLALGSSSQLTPHIGANIKNLAGEFYVGNLFKFTKEQLTNAFNAKGAVGLALYTGEDEYFGLNIVAGSKAFHLRVLGDWGKWYTANIGDFSSGSYQDDTNHLAAALTGDGIYGVLHRAADGKVTMYLYNAAKTSLLLKVETESTKTKEVYGIAAGYWDNKTENRFDCEYSDIRVGTSLSVLGVTAE